MNRRPIIIQAAGPVLNKKCRSIPVLLNISFRHAHDGLGLSLSFFCGVIFDLTLADGVQADKLLIPR